MGFALLQFVLIIAVAVPINYSTSYQQENRNATWRQHIDAMSAACIRYEDAMLSVTLTTLLRCFIMQREYLRCDSSRQKLDTSLTGVNVSSGLEAPCGLIFLSRKTDMSLATRQWRIKGHGKLHLNLTFLEFALPMPHGRCDRYQGSEILVVSHENATLNLTHKDSVFLCGEYLPFSMIRKHSRALLVYRREISTTQVGHFRIQYQVCDQNVTTHKIQTISRVLTWQSDKFFSLKLSTLIFFESGPKHSTYTIHLLGSKLTLLGVMFVLQGASEQHVHIDAFDGPGPAELHRHPVEHEVLHSKWIEFATFQAYLQITCERNHCDGPFIKYRWPSALPYSYSVPLLKDLSLTNSVVAEICSYGHYWYCLFEVGTRVLQNVEISLQVVNFHGPDYLGGFSEPQNCLLAGVTITDGYRETFMSNNNSLFKHLGHIPRSLAVDSVLPEITTCFHVPLTVEDRVVWDLPLKTFVSYGPTLILAIYAYGAYTDLSKSEIKLIMRPSYSAGLIVSCPSIPSDGFLKIGMARLSGRAAILYGKTRYCSFGNILFIKISNHQGRTGELASDVVICTSHGERMTSVVIASYLSDNLESGAVRSVSVQMNAYAPETEKYCVLTVTDAELYVAINYSLYTIVPNVVGESEYIIVATTLTSDRHYFGHRGVLTGRYSRLQVYMKSKYISVRLNATMLCTEAVQLLKANHQELERHLQQPRKTLTCQNYMIPLWNSNTSHNSSGENTYILYISSLHHLILFQNIITSKVRMGKLTALIFDWYMSNFLFIAHISLHGICSELCRKAKVQIAYKALVSHRIVLLEWNLLLTRSGVQITLSDIPMFGALLYVTSLNDECLEKLCLANIDIEDNVKSDYRLSIWDDSDSDQISFAEYHLLWTHKEYTWNEVENICQQLGGMRVASITTQMEYLLISRMLLGSAYHEIDTDSFRLPILSPCLMGSPLCVIYIGLRRQNTSFSWSDGRPTGYLRWNVNYFAGRGPNSVKYNSPIKGIGNAIFQKLLTEANSTLQPSYTNKTLCTVLIGSPGPLDMEFVSIPCDKKLGVSGIMCIKGGNKLKTARPRYRLTHLKLKAKDSQLVSEETDSYYNVDTLYEAFFQGKKPPKSQGTSSLPIYYESFNEEDYLKEYSFQSQLIQQTWTESIQNCGKFGHNTTLCNLFWPYNETSTNKLQNLTTDLFLTEHDQNYQITSLSVQIFNNSMIASNFCSPGGVFDGKQCIHVLQKPPDNDSVPLGQICQDYANGSHVYVYSVATDVLTLSSVLQRLDICSGQVSCYNEMGNTVVLHIDKVKPDSCMHERVDSATKYVVCSLQPVHPTCPPAYVTCNSGCISELFSCDGTVHCGSGEDEQNCTLVCGAVSASLRQSPTIVHLENCTCPELYFQCSSGGCIHSSKLCNGHADCAKAEDEAPCSSRASTQLDIDTRNDFIPDQEDSSDEKIYINLLKSVKKEVAETCGSAHQASCMKGHPACYSIDKMCLYDHTEDGRLKYCRNGLHLLECEHFWCSGSFKCRYSYCVPPHKVCNGVQDCPYGDDEIMCPVSTCINMLRCGQTCVHPNAICDGSVQCESGEDELVCGAPKCPPACQCSGYAMRCHAFVTFDTSFIRLLMLFLRHPKLVLTTDLFTHVTSLVFLDISYCNVNSISAKGPFAELHALIKLDLSHNSILFLSHGSLDGLSNLVQLDMSWNPLSYVEPQTFVHVNKLRVLSLQHCHLGVVLDIVAQKTQSLDILDMSFGGKMNLGCLSLRVAILNLTKTTVQYDKDYIYRCWKNVNQVISDQRGMCCLNLFKEKCYDNWELRSQMCPSLFSNRIIFLYSCILITATIICNSCVLIYKLLMPSSDTLLVCNLALANSFIVVPLCIFINWHVSYDTEFAFFESLLSRSVLCRVLGDIFIVFTQIATFFQMLISLQKYYGVTRACNIISEYKLFIYSVTSAAWLASILVCAFLRFQDVHQVPTTTVLEGFFYYYRYKYFIWPAFSILTTIFALVAIFSYGKILKYIHKTRITHIGVRHGKDITFSSMVRVTAILIFSTVSVLAAVCLTIWLCLTTTEAPQAAALIVLIYPLPSVLNPFLLTLSSQRIGKDCRLLVGSVM